MTFNTITSVPIPPTCKYVIEPQDLRNGVEMVCVYNNDPRYQKVMPIGDTFTLIDDSGTDGAYLQLFVRDCHTLTLSGDQWIHSSYDTGIRPYEFIPRHKLTEEEIFQIKLSGSSDCLKEGGRRSNIKDRVGP